MRLSHRRARVVPARVVGERGALILEMSIVGIFMVTLLAGTFDFGMAWRGGLAVTEAARAGARVGSSVGNDSTADRDLLLSAQAALQSSGLLDEVQRVVLYRSTTANGAVPPTCKTATATVSGCNILTGAQFTALTGTSPLDANGCISTSTSKGFCPTGREERQIDADYLGVYIRAEYRFMFRLLGTVQVIERTAVMRIEPQESIN